ncbi:hypothetical protein ACFSMW_08260 [Virgibacillus halophilus]
MEYSRLRTENVPIFHPIKPANKPTAILLSVCSYLEKFSPIGGSPHIGYSLTVAPTFVLPLLVLLESI